MSIKINKRYEPFFKFQTFLCYFSLILFSNVKFYFYSIIFVFFNSNTFFRLLCDTNENYKYY